MTASALPPFRLSPTNREVIIDRIRHLPDGWVVRAGPPPRSGGQNRLFHDIVDAFAKHIPEHGGAKMSAEQWKQLLIVSFSGDTSDGAVKLVPSLDGTGLVQIRESSAAMSKERASLLIEFCKQQAAERGVPLDHLDAP